MMNRWKRLLIGAVILCCALSAHGAGIFRVDAASTAATPDGQSWATAYPTLQAGTDAASIAGGGDVWVKAGNYTATADPVLTMKAYVAIYGGFAGIETARDQREWTANASIIDGQDTRRCINGSNSATLDGFTVTRGSADGGAGMSNFYVSPTVTNCVFTRNAAGSSNGGGMRNSGASPQITNCIFTRNTTSGDGGGMSNWQGDAIVKNCVFTLNSAERGGGMYNGGNSPAIANCSLTQNTANFGGGAVCNNGGGIPRFTNCILWGDTAPHGPEIYNISMSPVLGYSCVQGGYAGTANISADPLFAGAPGNLRLLPGSPCIDTGSSAGAPATDILNKPRSMQGAGVDMGAYEYIQVPIVTGVAATTNTSPTWAWASTDTGSGYFRCGFAEGSWTLVTDAAVTTFTPTSPLAEGSYTIHVQERDGTGDWSGSGQFTTIIDLTPPTGTLIINGGNEGTLVPSVTLGLTASDGNGSGVSGMQFSNDGTNWSVWENYGTTKAWTLTEGLGPKIVYARYRDAVGNVSTDTISDDIALTTDVMGPTGTIVINGGAARTTNPTVSLSLTASDGWGTGVASMQFNNDDLTHWSNWEPFATIKSWDLSAGDGNKTVSVRYRDMAGNVSTDTISAGIYLDRLAHFIRVDASSTVAAPDGGSWNRAYRTLQEAVNAASAEQPEIWVRVGTYTATTDPVLTMKAGVSVYAGFAGNESARNERNRVAGATVIDGENARRCVIGANNAALDGFLITRGKSGSGAGMYNNGASPTVTNCSFTQNAATGSGGGMYNVASSPTLFNCTFTLNSSASYGGGIYNNGNGYTVRITNCILWGDTAPSIPEVFGSNGNGIVVTYSCVQGGRTGTGNIGANPLFAAAPGDLRLLANSPCIDTGTATGAPLTDITGASRPQGAGVDMGAYECNGPWILGGITINSGASCTTTPQVALSLNWSSLSGSPVMRMRFSDDGATWTAWEPLAATRAYTLPAGDGYKTVRVQYRDAVGNVSDRLNDYILLDGTPPTGTIAINNGAVSTKNPQVTLSLTWSDGSGSGVTRMRFSDNGSTWTAWETLKATVTHALPLPPGGNQTVRVQYRDAAGNVSARLNDYIRLDLP